MTPDKRRHHGEGSVRQRSNGLWEARYTDADGKRRSVYAKSEKDANRKLRQAQSAVERGDGPMNLRLTVEQYLDEWLVTIARPRLRQSTFNSYRQIIKSHLIPAFGKKKLAKLTPADVQHYLNQKLESGLSKRSVTYHRAILRRALNDAMRHSHIQRNVVTLTDPPGQDHHEQRWLDPEESRQFIAAAREHRLVALWILGITSGMRKGELLGLRWRDVNLDQGFVDVSQQLQRLDGQLNLQPLKTDEARRRVWLSTIAANTLREHRAMQLQERLRAGELWQDTGIVFATRTGGPTEPRNVTRAFKNLIAKAGLPDIRFHDLRHSAASAMIAQGVDIKTVRDILGHSQVTLTLDTYSHLTEGQRRTAAARMDELYGS